MQRTFIQYNIPRTPVLGSRRRASSLPRDMGFGQTASDFVRYIEECGGRASRLSTVASSGRAGDETPSSGVNGADRNDLELSSDDEQELDAPSGMWADEPLRFEDAGIVVGGAPFQEPSATAAKWQPLTPGFLAREGCRVQNTFFHVAPPLPTPVRTSASHRSKSVPKDIGSSKEDVNASTELRPTPQASPFVVSSSVASTPVLWPTTPAQTESWPNTFSWNGPSTQFAWLQPQAAAPMLHFQHVPQPCARDRSVLRIEQYI